MMRLVKTENEGKKERSNVAYAEFCKFGNT